MSQKRRFSGLLAGCQWVVVGLLAATLGACASASYVPKDPCLIHTVQVDGVPHLYLNGQAHKMMLTGDIYQLTRHVPRAQHYAAGAETAASNFAVMYGGGLALMLTSPIPLFVGQDEQELQFGVGRLTAATLMFVVGTVLSYSSVYQLSKVQALRLDAINAYNDHVRLSGRCPVRDGGLPPPAPLPQVLTRTD